MLEVLKPGMLSTVQDLGRPGWASQGIGRSGALDPDVLRLANALVGNAPGDAGLEITLRGPVLRFHDTRRFALCGADFTAQLDGHPVALWTPHEAMAGATLEVGRVHGGCRTWLALSGGIALPPQLGSRSTDVNAALGPMPRALRAGDRLPLGPASQAWGAAQPPRWSLDPRPWSESVTTRPLRLIHARDSFRLDHASQEALLTADFRVSTASNRVGVRLEGGTLQLAEPFECVSEGCVPGVMQLPPGGQPIVLLGEHPVSGGYPRIAQLAAVDLGRLAQAVPGTALRFDWIGLETAMDLLAARGRARDELESNIHLRLAST